RFVVGLRMIRFAAVRAISRPAVSVSMCAASTSSASELVVIAPMTSATRMLAVIPSAQASRVRLVSEWSCECPCEWSWPMLLRLAVRDRMAFMPSVVLVGRPAQAQGLVLHGGQVLGVVQGVQARAALAADADQVAVLQAGQMRADGALGQAQMLGEVLDLVLAGLQVFQDQQPRGVGQGMEQRRELQALLGLFRCIDL